MDYHVFLVVFAWCSFGLVADIAGGVYVTCKGGFVDIRENTSTTITCNDVFADTVKWWMTRPGANSSELVASCTSSNCTVHSSGQYEVNQDMSSWKHELVYHQQDRAQDLNANVTCESTTHSGDRTTDSCTLNVISPAILSDCVVEEDSSKGTANGTCHFERAYSTNTSFNCKWHLTTKTSPQATIRDYGIIANKEEYRLNGLVYYRGQCTLSFPGNWDSYSYSVDFYPGSGPVSVPIGRLVTQSTVPASTTEQATSPSISKVTDNTVLPTTTEQATSSTNSTVAQSTVLPTTSEQATSPTSSNVTGSTVLPTTSEQTTSPTDSTGEHNIPEPDDDPLPIAAIAGGGVAAVVVVVIIVVIVVAVTRRRRRQPTEFPKTSTDDDYWEEHINAAYVSSVDLQKSDHKENAASLTTTTTTTNGNSNNVGTRLSAAAVGDYEEADIPAASRSSSLKAAEDGSDGYSTIGSTLPQTGQVPETDVHSLVNKSDLGIDPNKNGTALGKNAGTDVYAVVNKPQNGGDPRRNGTTAADRTLTDTYAVVDKFRNKDAPAKDGPVLDNAESTAEPEEDTYSHLQLSAVGPAPRQKPSSTAGVTQSTVNDDVYNKLNFH